MGKVLVVEDDEGIRLLLCDVFRNAGYTVRIARDGQDALTILEHEGGFVILLDMRLPKISGLEVIRWLEEHPKLAEANTIIAMSAEWASQQNTPSPSSALVRASFSKPFDLEEVLSLVQTHAPKLHSW